MYFTDAHQMLEGNGKATDRKINFKFITKVNQH